MNKLEEIKKYKLDRYKYYDTINGQEYEDDVTYLLQRIEIAQKALEHYADIELYKGIQQGELFADWFMRQNHVAVQALEKIKEP